MLSESSSPPTTSVTQGRRSRRIRSTPAREGGRADGARAAGPLELDLDHARLDVGPDEDEVSPVGLHRRPHEVDDPLQLAQAVGPLGVAQLSLGLGHATILPCPNAPA